MGAPVGGGKGPMADINLAPLIDIVLVLLVVFMVITPMIQAGVQVELPEAHESTTVRDVGQHVVISIDIDEALYVEETEVTLDTLLDEIAYERGQTPDEPRSILLNADRNLEYHQVERIMRVLSEAGMQNVLVAAEEAE